MRFYCGERGRVGTLVTVDGGLLPRRLELRNHSPTGFDWGRQGQGAAQLALAILADSLGAELALEAYQQFLGEVVAGLDEDYWELFELDVRRWYHSKQQEISDRTDRSGN